MPSVRASFYLRILVFAFVWRVVGTAIPSTTLYAAAQDTDLRVEPITAYNFIVDSNVESPSTYAPAARRLARSSATMARMK